MSGHHKIPDPLLEFAHVLCCVWGVACIAGSSATVTVAAQENRSMKPEDRSEGFRRVVKTLTFDDVDVFIPAYPADVRRSENLPSEMCIAEHVQKLGGRMLDDRGPGVNVRELVFKSAQFCGSGIDLVKVRRKGSSRHLLSSFVQTGIESVWNVHLRNAEDGKELPIVQIIVLDAVPKPGQTWNDCVVSMFDIDVCKCVVPLDSRRNLGHAVTDERSRASLLAGEFGCTIRPCGTFKIQLARLRKCVKKGFKLSYLKFDSLCSEPFVKCTVDRFQHMHAFKMAFDILTSGGVIADRLATDLFDSHIKQCFDRPSVCKDKKRAEELVVLNAYQIMQARQHHLPSLVRMKPRDFAHFMARRAISYHRKVVRRVVLRWWKRKGRVVSFSRRVVHRAVLRWWKRKKVPSSETMERGVKRRTSSPGSYRQCGLKRGMRGAFFRGA